MTSSALTLRFATVLFASLCLTACDHPDVPGLQVGKSCTIQFRRDALGAGASMPVSPMTNSINGADTSIDGTLKRVSPEWIVIETSGREITIPKTVILLIQQ